MEFPSASPMWQRPPAVTIRLIVEHDLRRWMRAATIDRAVFRTRDTDDGERRTEPMRSESSGRRWLRPPPRRTRRRRRDERRRRREQLALLRALHPCPDLSSAPRSLRPLPNSNCVAPRRTGRSK